MKLLVPSFGVLVVIAWAASALADDPSACVTAYEHGQVNRRDGHFDGARADFATCTADACPAFVRERCLQFARDLEVAQPTVIVVARDAHRRDLPNARIAIDGAIADTAPSVAMRLDPGAHTFRLDAGAASVEQRIVLREGEKDRRVELVAGDLEPPKPRVTVVTTSKPVGAWIMTGVAATAFASAAAMSATGWGIYASLSSPSSCGHACTDAQVAPLRVLWPGAFVALGVGVVSGVVAVILYVTHRRPPRELAILF